MKQLQALLEELVLVASSVGKQLEDVVPARLEDLHELLTAWEVGRRQIQILELGDARPSGSIGVVESVVTSKREVDGTAAYQTAPRPRGLLFAPPDTTLEWP